MLVSTTLIVTPNFCGFTDWGAFRPLRARAPHEATPGTFAGLEVQPTCAAPSIEYGARAAGSVNSIGGSPPPPVLWLADRLTGARHTLSNFRV